MKRKVEIRWDGGSEQFIVTFYEDKKINSIGFSYVPNWIDNWLKTGKVSKSN